MLAFELEGDKKTIIQTFEYPNTDIEELYDKLKAPKKMCFFIGNILTALEKLQSDKEKFGNLRPEFLFLKETDKSYVLLDKMGVNDNIFDPLKNFYLNKKSNFTPPEIFANVCANNKTWLSLTYKIDVFCLGMILLNIMIKPKEIEQSENKPNENENNENEHNEVENDEVGKNENEHNEVEHNENQQNNIEHNEIDNTENQQNENEPNLIENNEIEQNEIEKIENEHNKVEFMIIELKDIERVYDLNNKNLIS